MSKQQTLLSKSLAYNKALSLRSAESATPVPLRNCKRNPNNTRSTRKNEHIVITVQSNQSTKKSMTVSEAPPTKLYSPPILTSQTALRPLENVQSGIEQCTSVQRINTSWSQLQVIKVKVRSHYHSHSYHYTTLHYTTLHYTTLHYTTPHHTTPHHTTLHHTTQRPHNDHTTPHHTAPHNDHLNP